MCRTIDRMPTLLEQLALPAVPPATAPYCDVTEHKVGVKFCPCKRTLELTAKKRTDVYDVAAERVDGGLGVRLSKRTPGSDLEESSYDIFLSDAGPAHDTCDCKGFTSTEARFGVGHCKHSEGLRTVPMAVLAMPNPMADAPAEPAVTAADVDAMHAEYKALTREEFPEDLFEVEGEPTACELCGDPMGVETAGAHLDCRERAGDGRAAFWSGIDPATGMPRWCGSSPAVAPDCPECGRFGGRGEVYEQDGPDSFQSFPCQTCEEAGRIEPAMVGYTDEF